MELRHGYIKVLSRMVKKWELVVIKNKGEKRDVSKYWWCRKHYGYSFVYNRRDENKPYQICCLRKSSLGER